VGFLSFDDGRNMFLLSSGSLLPDYIALYPRRQNLSYKLNVARSAVLDYVSIAKNLGGILLVAYFSKLFIRG
jgi:hypothetical protein